MNLDPKDYEGMLTARNELADVLAAIPGVAKNIQLAHATPYHEEALRLRDRCVQKLRESDRKNRLQRKSA